MYQIKFGTDGWREIIADNFTSENVRRVSVATALWLKEQHAQPLCVVGHDCRFGGELFARETALTLANNGVKVLLAKGMVSTPMISLAALKLNAQAGIIITASHNPPAYNGFKIKAGYGGPATPDEVEKIEKMIPASYENANTDLQAFIDKGLIEVSDFESLYEQHVRENFDIPALEKVAPGLIYDAMFGAGQDIVKKLLPAATLLHADRNPGFNGRAPEPILKNLPEIAQMMQGGKYNCGLATDGDADRIGFFDEKGNFVDSHHLILLLMDYLVEYKGYTGKVVKSFSVSDKVAKFCKIKGLEYETTRIGFKYICEIMVNEDVLVGAEESGGIALKGHLPERDGVWCGLVMMEYMARSGKTVSQLIQGIYDQVGSFAVERYDLHISHAQKDSIIAACKSGSYKEFGTYKVEAIEDTDGYKFRLGDEQWVMIRPSGTEPVLRVYAESKDSAAAFAILDATKAAILK